jgi:hypothetical protein
MTVALVASAGLMVLVAVAMSVLNRPDGDLDAVGTDDDDGDAAEPGDVERDRSMADSMP